MKIPQSVRALLPKAPLAHLTTLNSGASESAGELGAIREQCFLNSAIRHQPHQRSRHV